MAYDKNNAAQRQLIQWVEFRVDSVTPVGATPEIKHESIYQELEASARLILRTAPLDHVYLAGLDGTDETNAEKVTIGGRLVLPMPDDFVRFLRMTCTGWLKPLDTLIDVRSPEYAGQFSSHSRALLSDPRAALVPYPKAASRYAIEPFPAPASSTSSPVEELAYVGLLDPEDMPELLHDAMVWESTFRVLLNTRDFEAARTAQGARDEALLGLHSKEGQP